MRLSYRLLVTPILHLLGQHEDALMGTGVAPGSAAECTILPSPPVHAFWHRVGLGPHNVLAHDPAVCLQGEGDAVGHEHEVTCVATMSVDILCLRIQGISALNRDASGTC